MSKKARCTDAERTAIMLDLIRRRYLEISDVPPADTAPPRYVVLEEVAPSTGFGSRYADALVLSAWPSDHYALDGYEIKASRADLKRELADPRKYQALARFCDRWTLVVWDEAVIGDLKLPADWGIVVVSNTPDDDGERSLRTVRKAAKRTPEPWPRPFVASLVRNAYEQGVAAEHLARAFHQYSLRVRREAKRAAEDTLADAVRPLAQLVYGKDWWRLTKEERDPETIVKLAIERLSVLPLLQAVNT